MQPTFNIVADTICRTAELGLTIDNAAEGGQFTHLFASPRSVTNACPGCGQPGKLRDHVTRNLVDLPVVGFPTRLHVRVPRYTCTNDSCWRKTFRASLACAADGKKLTHRTTRWILQRLAIDRMSVAATAKALGVGWDLVNDVACDMTRTLVYAGDTHLEGVRLLGVDEHVWKHTHRPGDPSAFVTVIVDLTPLADGTGPARLLDMKPGRSAEVLRSWLAERSPEFRDKITVVSMDGFTGYASAVDAELPQARKVMDPFHVIRLAADKLDECRQRIQRATTGRRGRKDDPRYKRRRTLLTRCWLLTKHQWDKIEELWATDEDYEAVRVTWDYYQMMVCAYNQRGKDGKTCMENLINDLHEKLPAGLKELKALGRTLWRRKDDILAYFDLGTSNGPVEAINGRLEHLRGIALGFRNLDHYILRSLIHSGQLQNRINAL